MQAYNPTTVQAKMYKKSNLVHVQHVVILLVPMMQICV
jgi:hypothetical protein